MKFGKKGLLIAATLSLFALSACGKSAKETVVSSTESILNAKQMESSGSISFKLDANVKDMKPEDKAAMDMLKNVSITVDSKADKDAKKDEVTIGANIKTDAMKLDLSIPMFMDEGKKALYVKANNVKSLLQLAGIPGDSFSKLEGKVIKMDMKDLGEVDTKESMEIQAKVQKALLDAIKALPEDKFTKEKDVYTVKLAGKDLKTVIEKVFDEMSEMKNFTGTKQDIEDFKKELKNGDFGKSSVSLTYTMDGDTIKKQDAAIHIELKNPKDKKEEIKFDMNINSKIKSINKPIKFTFDTSEKNIVPMEELQKMIGEFMSQSMMNGGMDGMDGGAVTPQPAPAEPAA